MMGLNGTTMSEMDHICANLWVASLCPFSSFQQTTADESPPSLANQETTEKDYLQWANAFIVVYSITDHNSFEVAQKYLDIISQQQDASKTDIPLALVGNKLDLERYR